MLQTHGTQFTIYTQLSFILNLYYSICLTYLYLELYKLFSNFDKKKIQTWRTWKELEELPTKSNSVYCSKE